MLNQHIITKSRYKELLYTYMQEKGKLIAEDTPEDQIPELLSASMRVGIGIINKLAQQAKELYNY
jgi:hypothetical protein